MAVTVGEPTVELLGALARLDVLLRRALAAAEAAYGFETAGDPFRGLHVSAAEVERLLGREPGQPVLGADAEEGAEHDSVLCGTG